MNESNLILVSKGYPCLPPRIDSTWPPPGHQVSHLPISKAGAELFFFFFFNKTFRNVTVINKQKSNLIFGRREKGREDGLACTLLSTSLIQNLLIHPQPPLLHHISHLKSSPDNIVLWRKKDLLSVLARGQLQSISPPPPLTREFDLALCCMKAARDLCVRLLGTYMYMFLLCLLVPACW